jgi:amino acid permease
MSDGLLSRDEVLGGLPARRAATVLHAIRSRTAAAAARSRRPLAGFVGEHTAVQREGEFLAALAAGRTSRSRPSVQSLERYAADWAPLVPDQPALRAAIVQRLAEDDALPYDRVPRMRAALGLDDAETAEAYELSTGAPIDAVYVDEVGAAERFGWWRSRLAERLERLPPFWVAFAITLTECVGAGILALPVAMGGIGPLGAVILIAVFGAINVMTVAALSEAIARTGSMHYGTSYFGRLVGEHFSRGGVALLSAAVFALNGTLLLVALIGFGSVLSALIGLPIWAWAAALFGVNLWLLGREHLDGTIASAMIVGAVNIVLVVALCGIAVAHADSANFQDVRVPLLDGRPVDTSILALVFGVVMLAFFGHTSAANAAKVVLARDPSGRALVRGNVAALAVATVLYALTALAFGGALERDALLGATGTALEPLAEKGGVAVEILGSLFAVLAIGMGSVYASLGLYNQVLEWRPQRNRTRRLVVGTAVPTVLFVFALGLVASNRESFTAPLGYVGALTVPLLAGVMPMVLIVASRRRGELVPPKAALIGSPVVATLVGCLFLVGVLIQALLIWDNVAAQAAGVAVTVATAAAIASAWRFGAFRPRTVIELRREPERDIGVLAVTTSGHSIAPPVWLDGHRATPGIFARFSQVREVVVGLPPEARREVHVWAHRLSPDGGSENIPVRVEHVANNVVIRP